MAHILVERLRGLPVHADDVWEGGFIQVTAEIEGEAETAIAIPLWISQETGMAHSMPPAAEGEASPVERLVEAMLHAAPGLSPYRPGTLQVKEDVLARQLGQMLDPIGIRVEQVAETPAVDAMQQRLQDSIEGGRIEGPGYLESPDVDLPLVKEFAEAADAFVKARPWRQLSSEWDLVEVESPDPPAGMAYCSVLGSGGEQYGMGFYSNPDQKDEICESPPDEYELPDGGLWSLTFCDPEDVPPEDLEAWFEHRLPLPPEGLPMLFHFLPSKIGRPDREELVFVTALLRAIAETTEDEYDSGRWQKAVATPDGPKMVRLSLPGLLDRNERVKTIGGLDDDPELAMVAATQSHSRWGIAYAHRLLKEDRDNPWAFIILGHRQTDPKEAVAHYRRAMSEARRRGQSSPAQEDEHNAAWWQAAMATGSALVAGDRLEEAEAQYMEMLEMLPGEEMAAEGLLGVWLLMGRDEDARGLIEDCIDYDTAVWHYAQALVAYRLEGDNPESRGFLRDAVRCNPLVMKAIPALEKLGPPPVSEGLDARQDEAMHCLHSIGKVWVDTPGAIEWLQAAGTPSLSPRRKASQNRKRRQKKGKRK